MAKLIYAINSSLDGYIEDNDGNFDWGQPSEDLHAFFNDLLRPIGTHLYGRAMYDVMAYWETALSIPGGAPVEYEFARIWQAAEKIVYSTTLGSVSTARTRIERAFHPETIREWKTTSAHDMSIGGAHLAAQGFQSGLIDEYHVLIHPLVLGGGKPALPRNIRLQLELLSEQQFDGGVAHLRYRVIT
jgi:dihydrofolate reductase